MAEFSLEPTTALGKQALGLESDRVLVAVRVRPMMAKVDGTSGDQTRSTVFPDSESRVVEVADGTKRKRSFPFDYVFQNDQYEVYDCIGKRMLIEAFNGYNVCMFAYGQTGSGKTYTLLGMPGAGLPVGVQHAPEQEGITPRLCKDLFEMIQRKLASDSDLQIRVTVTMTEVYNEKVRDLLPAQKTPKGQEPPSLDIYEDSNKRIEVRGLTKHTVIGYERLMTLIREGMQNREVAETKMNECSSRSHQILQLHIVQQYEKEDLAQDKRDTEACISIVDLAGSERQTKTGTSGDQFRESININHSLLSLGRALNSFSEKGQGRVPLRDSKLTRLLSESFGGNSKTWMLATVSPAAYNLTESTSTLNYASSAKNITNNAKQNRLARAMELEELKETNTNLQMAYDNEVEKHKRLLAQLESLKTENTGLHQQAKMKKEVEDMQAQAVELRSARKKEYEEHYDALANSGPITLLTPKHDTFIGRAKISLKNIIDQTSNYHTLPLSNEANVPGGYNSTLIVNIYPVDQEGSADMKRRIAAKDLLGQRVDFVVHVLNAKGVPDAYNHQVHCQYSYKWAEKETYKTVVMHNTTDPEFDFKKRFAFSKMNQSLVEYFRSDSVIIFEVIGRSNRAVAK
eukprot:TRINITY_DN1175_c0_g4_i1.p1 TRINITY_DN1175_c0_g4~~TRINITY_DN1175_c0_g4_i1.p1  ORF type:complete len:660 (+),score=260.82 TRINITY_DN1175_c0_g4_i1:95-1981(+)